MAIGAEKRLLKKIQKNDLLPILNFHRISPHQNFFWNPLHPSDFDDLMLFLKKHFEIITFSEIGEILAGKKKLERPPLLLTFDDGYYDFIEYAVPILQKYEIRVSLNVVSEMLMGAEPFWTSQLYSFLQNAPLELINKISFSNFKRQLKSKDKEEAQSYALALVRFLKQRPKKSRLKLLNDIAPILAEIPFSGPKMMHLKDVKMLSSIHEIGAHAYSHESMGEEDSDFFQKDFHACSDFFREKLNLPLKTYAFPNGSYRKEQLDYLLKQGVQNILLVGEKYSELGTRLHTRFTIAGDSKSELRLKALGIRADEYKGVDRFTEIYKNNLTKISTD